MNNIGGGDRGTAQVRGVEDSWQTDNIGGGVWGVAQVVELRAQGSGKTNDIGGGVCNAN